MIIILEHIISGSKLTYATSRGLRISYSSMLKSEITCPCNILQRQYRYSGGLDVLVWNQVRFSKQQGPYKANPAIMAEEGLP